MPSIQTALRQIFSRAAAPFFNWLTGTYRSEDPEFQTSVAAPCTIA